MANLKIFLFVAATLIPCGVTSINESLFRERKVTEIDPVLDVQWMTSVKKWYAPMWSKLDRIRTASDMYKKPVSELTEEEVKIPACMIMENNEDVSSFNRKMKFHADPIMQGGTLAGWQFKAASWSGAIGGKFLFKLTDNKSFVLGATFWDDGQASWGLMATKPKLDDDIKKRIVAMIQGLGYTKEMVHYESYEKCKIGKSEL